ncbi:MAG: trypsin-like peptidase domain-containing protein, partial [Planctomycetota bacterium]
LTTVAERASQSVVSIAIWKPGRDKPAGAGSGVIIDDAGSIVTNHHVIEGATSISVTFASGDSYDATFVGAAPDEDLAVVRVEAPDSVLSPVPVGTSGDLRVGQRVLAIGSPFGLDQTLTVGHLSALGRSFDSRSGHTIYDVLQTDAAINPGNSGGALLDSAGRLIGVNTAIRSASRSSAGIGFAVPVDRVRSIVPLLIQERMRSWPWIGFSPVATRTARQLGVERGVLILDVIDGFGAEEAGIRPTERTRNGRVIALGDVIVAIEGQRIDDMPDLQRVLSGYGAGDTVGVTVEREGERRTFDVVLREPRREV